MDFFNKQSKILEKIFRNTKEISVNFYSKLGSLLKSKFNNLYKFTNFKLIPYLNKKTDLINNKLLEEDGREFWNVLSSSRIWSGRIIWTLVGVSTFGIIYVTFASVDETVQTVGKLEPKGKTIKVKVPLGGVIKDILVEEGQYVEKDQVLLKLDTTAIIANLKALDRVKSQINADISLSKIQLGENENVNKLTSNQKIRLSSLNTEYASRINAARSSVEQIKFQKESINEKIKSQKEILEIREQILLDLKDLIEIGGLSRVKYLKEKQEVIQLRGMILSSKSELNRISAVLSEAENKLKNTVAANKIDFSTKIEENVKQIAQIDKQISEAKLTLNYQSIESPVDGLVFDLKPEAPGYVVNSDSPILKIVPTDDIVARIFISNKDIAFIKKNQKVKLRVDAYPYNEFGELVGFIESIGSDVLEPDENYNFYRFPVTVKLEEPFIMHKEKKLPLITGMSLQANIVLRQRPVISIFTKRILPLWDSLENL